MRLATLVPTRVRRLLQRRRGLAVRLYLLTGLQRRGGNREVWALLSRGAALAGYAAASRNGLPSVDTVIRRRLSADLERQGYLGRALEVGETLPVRNREDRRRLRNLRGLHSVLSGAHTPVLAASEVFAAVPWRVLHLVSTSLPRTQTGYTLRTHYTAVAQSAAGLDPHVVTQLGYGGAASTCDGVIYHRLAGPPRGTIPLDAWLDAHVDAVAGLAREIRPAVLHAASDYLNALTAYSVGKAYGIPVVYETRGFWEETWLARQASTYGWDVDALAADRELPDVYVLRREREDACRRLADRVVTLSTAMAERVAAGGVPGEAIAVVPNAVDPEAFPVQTRDPDLAAGLGIAPHVTVVGYISSINEYEGIDTLIEAYGIIRQESSDPVRLLVVGDGDHLPRLRRQAHEAGLTDIIFAGRVGHDEVLKYYSLIDVFVVPRKPVPVSHLVTPLKPYEAFATGRTVVLSNVRALVDIAEQSGAAELFEAGDADSLARTLAALLRDPARRALLAKTGVAWVRAHGSWTANAEMYRRLYAELGAAPGQPGR